MAQSRKELLDKKLAELKSQPSSGKEKLDRRLERWERAGREGLLPEDGGLGVSSSFKPRIVRAGMSTSTGIVSLDYALGGGLAEGIVEIYGEDSVGKTTLLGPIISAAQAAGRYVALAASEYLDLDRYKRAGVDLDNLMVVHAESLEGALTTASWWMQNEGAIFILDSATAFRPNYDQFDEWAHVLYHYLSNTPLSQYSSIIVVDQVRQRRSVDPKQFFAGGTDSTARKIAQVFSVRLELSREQVRETDYDMVVDIVANTLRPPLRVLRLPVDKKDGIDVTLDLVRAAVETGVVFVTGNWYRFRGETLGNGERQAADTIRDSGYELFILQEVLRALVR